MKNKLCAIFLWFIMSLVPIFAVAFYYEGPTWIQNQGGQHALVVSSALLMFGLFILSIK